MSGFAITIIVVALGLIIGNIMLLKHSANSKFGKKDPESTPSENKSDNKSQEHPNTKSKATETSENNPDDDNKSLF